ncbi:AAA domain-containing protein [Actinoplanes oblitus]|uniref:AAA domain-containing protein n=1 Tax=Actinoplanes oblitus TaxID=3040509 RepID=A0ABY8WL94_9ACTN|nr:AAA domain-containing protein [Actinoplanes oblitus]WIM98629.1 AAA domain-containing protein [Actinoplanes oblitus]
MLSSLSLIDEYVVQRTSGLVAYLKELVEQSSEQVRDTAKDGTIWLDDYQEHFADEGSGELLEIHCPPSTQHAGPVVDRYRRLEALGRRAVDLSDSHELLFGIGLLTIPAGKRSVRRHLLTCPVELPVDVIAETARLLPSLTAGFRLEDRDFLRAEDGFTADREISAMLADQAADLTPLSPQVAGWLVEWKRRCWPEPLLVNPHTWTPLEEPGESALTLSPALLLRPRTRSRLIEFYGQLTADLQQSGAAAPLGLAQLVVPFEREQKQQYLAQTIRASLLDDADPLLPLSSNAEQRRILEVLRSDTAAVIQGPPGTGKTHTIANLICALLADGQRVLVTSEKGQALRVLKDKIPADVRDLCVLATGLRRGADDALDRSITALSELQAGTDTAQLARTVDRLADRRHDLLQRRKAALLDLQIVREDQYSIHRPGAGRYSGTLVDIVSAIEADRPAYEWIGELAPTGTDTPALTDGEAVALLDLLRTTTPERAVRGRQRLPDIDSLPEPLEINTAFAHLNRVDELLGPDRTEVAPLLNLDRQPLTDVVQLIQQAADSLAEVGLSELTAHWGSDDWRLHAARDRLARQNPEYWATLRAELRAVTTDSTVRAAAADTRVSVDPAADPVRLLGQALRLRAYLKQRHWIRRYLPAHPVELDAAELLTACTVDQAPPNTVDALEIAITYLHATTTVDTALRAWPTGNAAPAPRLSGRLAQLRDIERSAATIDALSGIRDHIEHHLRRHGVRFPIRTPQQWDRTARAIQAAPLIARARTAQDELDAIQGRLTTVSYDPDAAPEVLQLITALRDRDITSYASLRAKVGKAALDHTREHHCTELTGRLRTRHPALAARLTQDPHHPAWDSQLARLSAAWSWATAVRYQRLIASADSDDTERRLRDLDTQLADVTAQLAGGRALLHCLANVTEEQRAALQDYRSAMSSYGRGKSEHAERRLNSARSAMHDAQAAVPAWIMPLSNVIETIDIEPNSFDVVIVDEASQAGIDALFLLCLAPRVIIVGDDRQCAPGLRTELATVHESIDHHLNALREHVRESFNPVSNLYELLSARFPGVIRLKEHFRCMPEIIGWSSRQFYRDSLIPLRQFGADRLNPIEVVRVANAVEEGTSTNPKNPAEAEAVVDQIQKLLIDSNYLTKSIGVVVLQSGAQATLIDGMIRSTIDPAEIQRHDIRVGQPPDFQGDERDVILLSMTIARPRRPQVGRVNERRFNVAASRARDQLWLFTSIDAAQLKPDDMRHSLLTWMQHPPTLMTTDPQLDQAGRDELHRGFATLLQQHVFLDLRERNYAVRAQYPISGSTVDLVIIGDSGRLAVECETPDRPTTPEHIHERLQRDRELQRAGWQFVRIKHSDYLTDPEAALRPLWAALRRRGIDPRTLPHIDRAAPVWEAATLSADEQGLDDQEP